MIQLQGHLFNGQVALAETTTLVIDGEFAYFLNSDKKYALSEVKLQPRLGDIPRIFEINELRFETKDFEKVDLIEGSLGRNSFIHKAERSFRLVTFISTAFLVVIFCLYKFIIPMSAKKLAAHTPERVKEMLSKPTEKYLGYIEEYDKGDKLSEEKQEIYDAAIADLQKAFPDRQINAKLIYFKSANAFILANGKIFVTSKLVELARSSDEILAVLLHEMGHYHYHHVVENLIESSSISLLIIFITGGTEWTNIPILILSNAYSRESETQADDFAILTLQKLDKDPNLLADIFESMEKSEKTMDAIPTFLSTHPNMQKRIQKIKE